MTPPQIPLYGNYGMFIGFFDHSPAIRLGDGGRFCRGRVRRLRDHFENLCNSMKPVDALGDLYVPHFATSFGHTDDLAIVFTDDFETMSHIAAAGWQLESFTLALPMNPARFSTVSEDFVVDPKSFIENARDRQPALPLITITQIKLSGVFTLATGRLAQDSAAKLIVNRAEQVIKLLSETSLRECDAKLFSTDSLRKTRISVLETFAAEDLVLITFSENYSVAATLISAIRKLTLSDLWAYALRMNLQLCNISKEDGILREQFSAAKFLNSFVPDDQRGRLDEKAPLGISESLDHNHLLTSSYTTLAVLCDISTLPKLPEAVSGYIAINGLADISPGHEPAVADGISELWNSRFSQTAGGMEAEDWRYVHPGRHDLSFTLESLDPGLRQRFVKLDTFFHFIEGLFQESMNGIVESGFQELSTAMCIPIPRIGDAADNLPSYAPLRELLEPRIDPKRHVDVMSRLEIVSQSLTRRFTLTEPSDFDRRLRIIELGPAARSLVLRLYNEYISAISDPLLFDSVVDLYDMFCLLYSLLDDVYRSRVDGDSRLLPVSEGTREIMVQVIESLRNALHLRIGRSSARKEDRYADLRGSIADLVSGGDTVVKVSMAQLRRSLHKDEKAFQESRGRISGLIAHALHQRATVRLSRTPSTYLTLVFQDMTHAFHPEQLPRVLHEVAHLYFETHVCKSPEMMIDIVSEAPREDCGKDINKFGRFGFIRASELFSDTIVHLIVFGADSTAFVKHQISVFGELRSEILSSTGRGDSYSSVIATSIEFLHRQFTITEWVAEMIHHGKARGSLCQGVDYLNSHVDRFQAFASEHWSEVFPDATGIDNDLPLLFRKFGFDLCKGIQRYSHVVLEGVRDAGQLLRHAGGWSFAGGTEPSVQPQLKELFNCLDSGVTICECSFEKPLPEALVVFQLLKYYIISLQSDEKNSEKRTPSESRLKRFFRFAVVMKSLWHVSTRQRRRRMMDLIESVAGL